MTALMAVMVVTVVAVAIAYPLWKPGPQAPADPVGPAATLADLEEHKLRLYASIRELGFDYRTDKLEEADYEEEVERIKAEAAAVVREISELRSQAPRGSDELEAEIGAFRRRLDLDARAPQASGASQTSEVAGASQTSEVAGASQTSEVAGASQVSGNVFCTQCGTPTTTGDRFCSSCGSQLRTA